MVDSKVGCLVTGIVSAKGGSGKTITTRSIAGLAARFGLKCLLVDVDIATNGLTLLHLAEVVDHRNNQDGTSAGLFDYDVGDSGRALNFVTLEENLLLLPATYHGKQTSDFDSEILRVRLQDILSSQRASYDYIFLDAQAGVDDSSKLVMEFSDQIVVVSEYDPVSARGVERMKYQAMSMDIDQVWVLFNKVLPELASDLGDFLVISQHLPPIHWSADVVRAYVRSESAINLDEPNSYTLSIANTAKYMLRGKFSDAYAQWREDSSILLRDRIEEKLLRNTEELMLLQSKNIGQFGPTIPLSVALTGLLMSITPWIYSDAITYMSVLLAIFLMICAGVLIYMVISRRSAWSEAANNDSVVRLMQERRELQEIMNKSLEAQVAEIFEDSRL